MATGIENSSINTAAVTSTSPELNGNKPTDTHVSVTPAEHEKKMTIKEHHHDQGECE